MIVPWGSLISGAGSLLGGLFGSDAAGDAAAAQQAATEKAIAEQRRQFDLNRADQAPFMQTGTLANLKLRQLLGLGGTPGGASSESRESIRSRLLPQYSTQGTRMDTAGAYDPTNPEHRQWYVGRGQGDAMFPYPGDGTRVPSTTVDESGLQSAIDAELARTGGVDSNASDYGSLLKRFGASDLAADPVYQSGLQFGLDQGTNAINQRSIASGGFDSGATLKALTKYANDYGSTKANEAYNRYNNDQTNVFNRLSGVSGTGQTAATQVGNQGATMANQISALDTAGGAARAAGIMGGANAWSGALSGVGNAANDYFGGQRLKRMLQGYGGGYDGYSTPPYYDYGTGGPQ